MNPHRGRAAAAVLLFGLAAGCGRAEAPATPATPAAQALQPAAETAGAATLRFAGTLPCADCPGIRTELTLHLESPSAGNYELRETYLDSPSAGREQTFTSAGRWSVPAAAHADQPVTIYQLDGGGNAERARSFLRLNDQEIVLLDRAGNRIESELNYVLTRVADVTFSFGTPGTPGAAPPGTDVGPGAMVTDMAAGWPVMLRIGQELTARMTADRASGYAWALRSGSDAGIVLLQGAPEYEAPERAGAGGVEVFRFKAVKPGETSLTFDYARTTDTAPSRSAAYAVTVQ